MAQIDYRTLLDVLKEVAAAEAPHAVEMVDQITPEDLAGIVAEVVRGVPVEDPIGSSPFGEAREILQAIPVLISAIKFAIWLKDKYGAKSKSEGSNSGEVFPKPEIGSYQERAEQAVIEHEQ